MEKSGCDVGFVAFAFDQLKDGTIARGVVIDLQTFARELRDNLLDRSRFMKLNEFSAAATRAVCLNRRLAEGQ